MSKRIILDTRREKHTHTHNNCSHNRLTLSVHSKGGRTWCELGKHTPQHSCKNITQSLPPIDRTNNSEQFEPKKSSPLSARIQVLGLNPPRQVNIDSGAISVANQCFAMRGGREIWNAITWDSFDASMMFLTQAVQNASDYDVPKEFC